MFSCLGNPPWNPSGTDDGWRAIAALVATERSAARNPKAWAWILTSLGAGFLLSVRRTAPDDKSAGATVLAALCAAAAAAEARIASVESAVNGAELGRYFEQRHPPKPVDDRHRQSAALAAASSANDGGVLALSNALEACRLLFRAS